MPDDVVSQLLRRLTSEGGTRELMSEAVNEILVLRRELAAAQAQNLLWLEIAMQAQDKVDDLLEQLHKKAVRCDCS